MLTRLRHTVLELIYHPNMFRALKLMMMAISVVVLLTACNANETENTSQSPLADGGNSVTAAADYTKCWQKEVINVLYDLMGTVALTTYKKMTGGALAFMMVVFAIWMSYRLMIQLSSFKEETMGEVWTEITKRFFLCFVCGLIASNTGLLVVVLGDVIFPIYNAFLEFASEIMAVTVPTDINHSFNLFGHSFSLLESSNSLQCVASKIEFSGDPTNFPDSPKQMMNCMVCGVSHSLSFGMQAGFNIMRQTVGVTGWIIGLFTIAAFMCVKLAFVFYLIDTIFRFTVMVIMLPFMIMGYAFPKTRGLLSRGVANMLNSAGFMMFFALIVVICIQALKVILEAFKGVFVADPAGNVPFKDLSVPFICIMMICFLVFSSVKIAGSLCDSLVGGKSNAAFQQTAKALIVGAFTWLMSAGLKIFGVSDKKVNKFINFMGDGKGGK